MAESLLNYEELLAEIPGDDPRGENLRYVLTSVEGEQVPLLDVLKEARTEVNPADFPEDDPMRPSEFKAADWPRILRLATHALQEKSKHLDLATRITEALTKMHGFEGFAAGLVLIRRLFEECSDRMYPFDPDEPESENLDARGSSIQWLGESSSGARFPHTLRSVPLVSADGCRVSTTDWRIMQDGNAEAKANFEKAVSASSREACQATFDQIMRCQQEYVSLTTDLNQRLQSYAPPLTDLRAALADCFSLSKQILQQKGPAAGADDTGEDSGGDADNSGGESSGGSSGGGRVDGQANAGRAMATRADVYRRLAEAATLLEKLEPHSPIPFLLRRAVALGAMPFPQLMKALLHEVDLSNLHRELGIQESEE